MARVVYNNSYGSFRLSDETIRIYKKLGGKGDGGESALRWGRFPDRHDPILIQAIETVGIEKQEAHHLLFVKYPMECLIAFENTTVAKRF